MERTFAEGLVFHLSHGHCAKTCFSNNECASGICDSPTCINEQQVARIPKNPQNASSVVETITVTEGDTGESSVTHISWTPGNDVYSVIAQVIEPPDVDPLPARMTFACAS